MTVREKWGVAVAISLFLLFGKTSPLFTPVWSFLSSLLPLKEADFHKIVWFTVPFAVGLVAGRRGWLYGGVIPSALFILSFLLFRPLLGTYGRGSVLMVFVFVGAILLPLTVILGWVGAFVGSRIARSVNQPG